MLLTWIDQKCFNEAKVRPVQSHAVPQRIETAMVW